MNKRLKRAGFTLVELLVVIAIIGILASIVIPNVSNAIHRGQVAKAVSEVKNIETACTQILSDAGRSNFKDLLATDSPGNGKDFLDTLEGNLDASIAAAESGAGGAGALEAILADVEALEDFYSDMFYNLLRQGKNSDWARNNLDPTLRQKLANSYMELGEDSWGQRYKFWAGPRRTGPMMFRSYRIQDGALDLDDPLFDEGEVYRYDQDAEDAANADIPGSPRDEYGDGNATPDYEITYDDANGVNQTLQWYGFPAPKDLPVYVYSKGANQLDDANIFIQLDPSYNTEDFPFYGGGDDINNWDTQQGWNTAPRA